MASKVVVALGLEEGLVGGGPPWGRAALLVVVGFGIIAVMVNCFDWLWWIIVAIFVASRGGELAPVAGVLES